MSVSLIAGLIGGIGLFLLGMHLMTDGLVAIVGFHVNVRAFALPAVGIGMLAQLLAG